MPTFHHEKFMMILKFWNHIRGSSKHESPVYLIDDLNLTRLESLNICCNYRSLSMKIVKKKLRTLQELNEDILIVASTVWLSNYLVAGSEPFQHPRWMMKHKQKIPSTCTFNSFCHDNLIFCGLDASFVCSSSFVSLTKNIHYQLFYNCCSMVAPRLKKLFSLAKIR